VRSTAAAASANARSVAVNVFVAGTAVSSPACSSIVRSAAAASGLAGSFVIATATAPAARCRSSTVTISGVRPDCETAIASTPSSALRAS
jgi:hypothetical protein